MNLRSAAAFLATLSLVCGFAAAAYAAPPEGAEPRPTSAEALKDNGPPPVRCLASGRNLCRPTAVMTQSEPDDGRERERAWVATGWEVPTHGCVAGDLDKTLPWDTDETPKVDCATPGAVALPPPPPKIEIRSPELFRGPNGMPLRKTQAEALNDAPPAPADCFEDGKNLCVRTVTGGLVSGGYDATPNWAGWLFWRWDRPQGLTCIRNDQALSGPSNAWPRVDCASKGAVFEARRYAPRKPPVFPSDPKYRATPAEAVGDAPNPPPECLEDGSNLCVPTVLGVEGGPNSRGYVRWHFADWDRPRGLFCIAGDLRLPESEEEEDVDCATPGAVHKFRPLPPPPDIAPPKS